MNGGRWNPILHRSNEKPNKCAKAFSDTVRGKIQGMISHQSNYLPDVIQVVDFIILQDTPPHFDHPLHCKQANHFQHGDTKRWFTKIKNVQGQIHSAILTAVEQEIRCFTDVEI